MINADMTGVETIEEFQKEIRRQQEEAHGEDYCQIHDAIMKYMKDCESYMELGVHVGGTAAAALVMKPVVVRLIDIDLSRYNRFLKPIAEKYCKEHGIFLYPKQVDSTSLGSAAETDMLVIDSYHHPRHMAKELSVHGPMVKKYILAHDTTIINGRKDDSLYRCLVDWGKSNGFEEIERGTTNVGYTVIGKK